MERKSYTCVKCGNRTFETDNIRTTGAVLPSFTGREKPLVPVMFWIL